MTTFEQVEVPEGGALIEEGTGTEDFSVPDNPYVAYIAGDGIGVDITPAMKEVVDAAVQHAYSGDRKIHWVEIYAGEKADDVYGDFLPDETLEAIRHFRVAIKGPLTTPVGGGFRSLNVALRQLLDLYACVRPVRYYRGAPSPLQNPEEVDMVIFRENTEDVYSGIEWDRGTPDCEKVIRFLNEEMGEDVRADSGIGIKPISRFGSNRLIRRAIQYAVDHDRDSVTLVHKGNIMKFTEGAFRDYGYELAVEEFREHVITEDELWDQVKDDVGNITVEEGRYADLRGGRPAGEPGDRIVVKDRIADNMLQQLTTRTSQYDVIATMNLNGDYISDAAAGLVGGLGIAPGANLGDGLGLFEPTHGTAPKYAGQDKVNPSSLILSAVIMLQSMGWREAAGTIETALQETFQEKTVTYDFARQIAGAEKVKCSVFARRVCENMT